MEIKKKIIITQEDYENSYYKVKIKYDSYKKKPKLTLKHRFLI